MLHAAANQPTGPQTTNQVEVYRWWMVDIYQTLGRLGVPLFVMLTGALLLQPSKIEPVRAFFKKRWARIGLPFLFWGAIYLAWDYFADNLAITAGFIFQKILSGPYFQFWYLYMLVGLYLLTPILRLVVAQATPEIFKYFFIVWLLCAFIIPIPGIIGAFYIDGNLLTLPLWAGYFVLGVFLLSVKMRRRVLLGLVTFGVVLTVIGTYLIAITVGGQHMYYFQDYFSPTMILASAGLFVLLTSIKVPENKTVVPHPKIKWLLKRIALIALLALLVYVIIQLLVENQLGTLQQAYLGFTITGNTTNAILSVRLITVVALFVCLGVIVLNKTSWLLKQISQSTLAIFLFHVIVLETLQRGYLDFVINDNVLNSIVEDPLITFVTLFICLGVILPLRKVPMIKRLIG
jgi:surface polysaccharide O-acyltransferase-like enzyme